LLALGLAWGVLLALALLRSTGLGIYYTSLFSVFPLGIAYFVLLLALWGVAHITRNLPARKVLLGVLGAVFFLLPIAEELFIAWRFTQACREAGTFIYKKVQVEGFYDETGTGSLELVRSGTYRFIESRADRGYTRLTLGDAQFMREALARYRQKNPGKDPLEQDIVRVKLDARTEALVFPRKGDSWRITLLDRPTARYHYKMPSSHRPFAHRIVQHEAIVVDTSNGEMLARYTRFSRDSPWFYVWFGKADFSCDAPGRWPLTRGSFSIYRQALEPVIGE
jgi:hypothetical protein